MNIEVKQVEPKVWGLFVGGSLLGTSKNRFDADHAKAILEGAYTRVENVMQEPVGDDPTVQRVNG